MRVSEELKDWYNSLPEGRPSVCYHCGHEGELTGPPMSGMCVDCEACYMRQLDRRFELWQEYGSRFGLCVICGEYGRVLQNPAGRYVGNGVTVSDDQPMCVDYRACNLRQCELRGHHWSGEERHCVTQEKHGFVHALENVGRNTWLLWRYCVVCDERQDLMTCQESEAA